MGVTRVAHLFGILLLAACSNERDAGRSQSETTPLQVTMASELFGNATLRGAPADVAVFEGDTPKTIEWIQLDVAAATAAISVGVALRLPNATSLDFSGTYELSRENQLVVTVDDTWYVSQSGKLVVDSSNPHRLSGSFVATMKPDRGLATTIEGTFVGPSLLSCSIQANSEISGVAIDVQNWTLDRKLTSEFCQRLSF